VEPEVGALVKSTVRIVVGLNSAGIAGALSMGLRDTVAFEVPTLVKSTVRTVGSDTNVDCFGA